MPIYDVKALKAFDKSWDLIPLHRWDSEKNGRKDGKRPLDRDWTVKEYNRQVVLEAARRGHNVGVRLKKTQLVVDVDPRNMPEGRNTFAELCKATGLDIDNYPHVKTGSGGLHVYMSKPEDETLVDSLSGYEGVEFKSFGRQVVAPGSIHPDTGKHYKWQSWLVGLDELPPAPKSLLALARRPVRGDAADATAGMHTQQEVAEMLDHLDPEDFRNQDDWLRLMMACHHASGGTARDEFIEWSTRDPAYHNHGWIIGRRWDSLHAGKRSAITARTLYKLLSDKGKGDAIPDRGMQDDEFETALVDIDKPENDDRRLLQRCNDNWVVAAIEGKTRVFVKTEDFSDTGKPLSRWVPFSVPDFKNRFQSLQTVKETRKGPVTVFVANEWLNWPKRREAKGTCFRPMKETPGFLNLWNGWATEPKPGDWSLLQDLIENTLCDGNKEVADYVIRWMAYMIQKPWLPAETAICFHGEKGTGKSTLGSVLVDLIGLSHAIQVTSSGHFTGRFNGHFRDKVFVFADEAVSPVDRDAQEVLKTMITSKHAAYEKKGVDIETGQNCLHVMMASNHDWFVKATGDERRYMITEVSTNRQNDKAFFRALYRQMYEEGGLQALMHDLMVMDLGEWAPRDSIPHTKALDRQKLHNLEPIQKWWYNCLLEARLCETVPPESKWTKGPVKVFRQNLMDSFDNWGRQNDFKPKASNRGTVPVFLHELEKVTGPLPKHKEPVPSSSMVEADDDGMAEVIQLKSLDDMRQIFNQLVNVKEEWS